MRFVEDLRRLGIEVKATACDHTVYFENIYSHNQDHRTQRVLQTAAPFSNEQLQDINAAIYHLGPLLAGDIPLSLIKQLAAKGKVSLDVQGYLRKVENNNVCAIDWEDKIEALKHIHTLKANESEMEVLTGHTDVHKAALLLHDWGVKEVVITLGSLGSVIYTDGIFYTIPAYVPSSVTDATGCGDTYMAGYLYKRAKGVAIQEAGEFAAAMASIKIAAAGPFTGTEKDVTALLENYAVQ
jgi:sugar/nucleoside kinase (ribokinase family)